MGEASFFLISQKAIVLPLLHTVSCRIIATPSASPFHLPPPLAKVLNAAPLTLRLILSPPSDIARNNPFMLPHAPDSTPFLFRHTTTPPPPRSIQHVLNFLFHLATPTSSPDRQAVAPFPMEKGGGDE